MNPEEQPTSEERPSGGEETRTRQIESGEIKTATREATTIKKGKYKLIRLTRASQERLNNLRLSSV